MPVGWRNGCDLDVEVLHVWRPPSGISIETPTTGAPHETLSDVVRRAAAHQLSQLLADYPRSFRPRIEVGAPHELIVTLAASDGHDLIVLGRTGMGRAKNALGSVAERVIAMAPCPVLTLAAPRVS